MRYTVLLLAVMFLSSCFQKTVYELPADYQTKRDTLVIRDTVVVVMKDTTTSQKTVAEKSKEVKKPAPEKHDPYKNPVIHEKYRDPVVQLVVTVAKEPDTVFHYYKNMNRKVSVKITPWNNAKRWTILYDPFGNETYRMESVRMSFTISVDLKFHDNGAVSEAKIHNNPGASMYWYETYITFSINNEPEWKRSERLPLQSLNDIEPHEYWVKATKQWKKQEVMEGLPVKK